MASDWESLQWSCSGGVALRCVMVGQVHKAVVDTGAMAEEECSGSWVATDLVGGGAVLPVERAGSAVD